jgi:hypothetical protein
MAMMDADCGAALGAGAANGRYQAEFANQANYGASGFVPPALPAWSVILKVGPNASTDEIKRAYHALAGINHPDHGGSTEKMTAINAAYEQAMKTRE